MSYKSYNILIEKKAQKFLKDLVKNEHEKIVNKIKSLTSSAPQSLNIKKVTGLQKPLSIESR